MTQPLFDKRGGYRQLHSFTYATLIHLATIRFCKRFISYKDDPLGKDTGQMIGAARSGRQNIIEGSERAATSKETEMKLTDVARGSLAELLGDYEIYLADRGIVPWSRDDQEHKAIHSILLPKFRCTADTLHDYGIYFQGVKTMFSLWLDNDDETVVARAMIVLLERTMALLSNQIKSQGEAFLENGGFRERLYQNRNQVAVDPDSPECPECSAHMRQRVAKSGSNAGNPFWGCSNYPECKGIRPMSPATDS